MATGSFDQASGNRIPRSQVFVVPHSMAMSFEIPTCCFNRSLTISLQFFQGRHPTKSPDHRCHVPVKDSLHPLLTIDYAARPSAESGFGSAFV